jgi:hypothetical protein
MPTRAKLVALVHELRNARTALLPMEIAERVQHTIVRVEQLLASPAPDADAVEVISREARQLLDECNALLRKP